MNNQMLNSLKTAPLWWYGLLLLFLLTISIPIILWIQDYFTSFQDVISSSVLSEFASFQGLIISFWGLVVNVILLILAYKAFKNFDVKKQFLNKQLDVVSELASEISTMELSNMMYRMVEDPDGESHRIVTGYTMGFYSIVLSINPSDYDLICVQGSNIEHVLPFLKFRTHPLLPKPIAKQLNKMAKPVQGLSIRKDKLPPSYVLLYNEKKKDQELTSSEKISQTFIYPYYKNPAEFTKDSLELRREIIKWFEEYGAKDINI